MTTPTEREAMIADCKIYARAGTTKQLKALALRCADMLAAVAQQVAVPQGWQLVPIDPTKEMLVAAAKYDFAYPTDPTWGNIYKTMLTAAPQPPQPEPRKPLTADQAWELTAGCDGIGEKEGLELVRLIEAAHGIKEQLK